MDRFKNIIPNSLNFDGCLEYNSIIVKNMVINDQYR